MENFALDPRIQSLYDKETIAGAVAREARRCALHGYQYSSDGIAYKAAFDRMGSSAHKHIETMRRDVEIMKIAGEPICCQRCEWGWRLRELIDGEACPCCLLVIY